MQRDDGFSRPTALHHVLDHLADAEMSAEYWDKLFNPLREFLIARLKRFYSSVPDEDIADAADEIILRLYRYFDFQQLSGLSDMDRRKRFYGFVKRTIYSVMVDQFRKTHSGTGNTAGDRSPPAHPRGVRATEWIAKAFQRLPTEDQQILRYRVIDGLTYEAIQEEYRRMGSKLSNAALRMRVMRALDELRRRLSEDNRTE